MTITVVVPGDVVGKNQAHGVNFRTKTIYVPGFVKKWQRRVAVHAWFTAREGGWPPDAFLVREAGVRIERFNVSGDYDRGNTYAHDALQFQRWPTPRGEDPLPGPIGIIDNDRGLFSEGSPPTRWDDGGPRVVLTIRLTALRSPSEAERLRERWFAVEARRKERKRVRRAESQSGREIAEIERRTGVALF